MNNYATVQCPWCFERVELWVDPETEGTLVEDCEVCCRPWQVQVSHDGDGRPLVHLARA